MRDYGKVFSTFWTSDSTRSLTDDGKTLALYLLTGPHTNQIGCFRLPDGYVSEDLRWSPQRVSKGFTELFRNGFVTREEGSKWVFIHKYLKWNPIENPNQAKSAFKLFDQIPSSSSVKPLAARALLNFAPQFSKGFETLLEPFQNPSETVPEPFRNQEQKQEQEKKQEQEQKQEQELRARAKTTDSEKLNYGENGNVLLTEAEYSNLCAKFGQEKTEKAVTFLDLHIGAKGKDEYKSHNLALQKWVYAAVEEREVKQAARASPQNGYVSPAQRRLEANREAGRRAKEMLFGKQEESNAAAGL